MTEHLPGGKFTKTLHETLSDQTKPENNHRSPFHVVVTGAGKGLGRAISLCYARAGASHICISSRTKSDLDSLSAELKSINSTITILSVPCDTSDPAAVKSLASTVSAWPRLDVVIANAGVISHYITESVNPKTNQIQSRRLPSGIVEDDDFDRVTNINYLGSYYVAKYFTPLLLRKENPSDVRAYLVITSLAAHSTDSAFTPVAYNVSKLANCRMVEHMAADHGEEGLVAFAVHPGEVVTPQTQGHSTAKGDMWESLLQTDINLAGGFCTWLTRERREWLSGRYLSIHWDVDELEAKKDEIVQGDKLKFRMVE